MKILASVRWRILLTVWLVYSVHFATNVVREHYPAFTLVERLSLKVDEYQGFHSDIFLHTDGHSYIASNVAVSVVAALPLLVFDPVLDALERHRLSAMAELGRTPDPTYRTDKPNRRAFFRLVTERGLDLRFGAATVVTSVFLMTPLSALSVVMMFNVLVQRGVSSTRATGLALLFAFGTPLFFRTAPLNPNMFLMYAVFAAFYLLWQRGDERHPVSMGRRVGAGLLCGFALAADYAGAVLLLLVYGYLLVSRLSTASFKVSFRESLAFVGGTIPPVLFLWYSQWAMFGNPFLPNQHWLYGQNYGDRGYSGFDWPAVDLLLKNLFDPTYGMYLFGPLLLLGLIPARRYAEDALVLPRPERRFVAVLIVAFLAFCSANQYARMQFNTGFRYLAPLMPFIFLQLSDHVLRMPRWVVAVVAAIAVAHSWVLAAVRESVPDSYRLLLTDGIRLPWLTVLRKTSAPGTPFVASWITPVALLAVTVLVVGCIWWWGSRVEAARRESA